MHRGWRALLLFCLLYGVARGGEATDLLLVSNAPERVAAPGTLLESRLTAARPARLLFHHLNASPTALALSVELLNPSPAPVRVRVVYAAAGPTAEVLNVGHLALWRYLQRESRGDVLTVPAAAALAVASPGLPPGMIVSGLARFQVLTVEGAVMLRVRAHVPAERYRTAPLRAYAASPVCGDYHYPVSRLELDGQYTVGEDWLFLLLGGITLQAERPGQELAGAYGAWHVYTIRLRNPRARPARVRVLASAGAGPARMTFAVSPDDWRQTGVLLPGNPALLHTVSLAAGTDAALTLITMPESGSNYPLTIIVTAQEP